MTQDRVSDHDVGRFFDSLTDDYTRTIERCFPRYREMLWALLDYLPPRNVHRILELGCGTGNLSVLLREKFPDAAIELVDLSPESLQSCRERLASESTSFRQADFRELNYGDAEYDLVISSISIHHLEAAEKRKLYAKIEHWLADGGVFAMADQHAGATEQLYQRHIENWKALTMAAGSTADEWEMWMRHQSEHDYHDTLVDQIDWLRQAKFEAVDCPWRYLLWAVLICLKA